MLIVLLEAAASYHPQPMGVLVRRMCDVNAELHIVTQALNQGGGVEWGVGRRVCAQTRDAVSILTRYLLLQPISCAE